MSTFMKIAPWFAVVTICSTIVNEATWTPHMKQHLLGVANQLLTEAGETHLVYVRDRSVCVENPMVDVAQIVTEETWTARYHQLIWP